MKHQYYTCDVFTDRPFSGNQLAVFPDAVSIPETLLQTIAREFNFSETVFVYPPADPKHTKRVRIFTPGNELPFAGHPTIGTAITLEHIGAVTMSGTETIIVLEEGVGPVPVVLRKEAGRPLFAQLTAAKLPEFSDAVPSADSLARLLGVNNSDLNVDRFPLRFVSVGFPFLFVAVKNRSILGSIRIDISVMEHLRLKEIFVFTDEPEQPQFHYRARMFAPLIGIPEDPATGSAAAAFAGYLAALDHAQDGTQRWNIEQGFEMGRPSLLYIEAEKKNGAITAVRVGGNAVMMMRGVLEL